MRILAIILVLLFVVGCSSPINCNTIGQAVDRCFTETVNTCTEAVGIIIDAQEYTDFKIIPHRSYCEIFMYTNNQHITQLSEKKMAKVLCEFPNQELPIHTRRLTVESEFCKLQ